MPEIETDWKLGFNSGGKLLSHKHVISMDGKYTIAIFKTHLKVYSLDTRQSIRNIDLDRDLSDVTDVKISSKDALLLYLFTPNQILVVNWKNELESGPIVKQYTLPMEQKQDGIKHKYGQILKLIDFCEQKESKEDESKEESSNLETVFVLLCGKPREKKGNYLHSAHTRYIVRYSATSNTLEELLTIEGELLSAKSTDGTNLAFVTNKNNLLYVQVKQDGDQDALELSSHKYKFPYKTTVCSLAVSNGESPLVALGTVSGVIQLLYLGSDEQTTYDNQRLLKWHVDGVSAVEFSPDGSYLLSGGREKVLVLWQLETEKQQFLPRLNGPIFDISIDSRVEQLYGLTLELTPSTQHGAERYYEFLVLNALDLSSKLDVNGIRPKFSVDLHKTLQRDAKKFLQRANKVDEESLTKIRHDVTTSFEVEPESGDLYLPFGSYMQVYNMTKNEQVYVAAMAQAMQQGKVRQEAEIEDPMIEQFVFSKDGSWMCTFDALKAPQVDGLMSSKDVKYCLKFWKYVEGASNADNGKPGNHAGFHWELCTKILDPHGPNVKIAAIIPAPRTYYNGLAFATADTKGGVRLWRPRIPKEIYSKVPNKKMQQTAWTLRRLRLGTGQLQTPSVALAWSPDSSLIAVAQETSLILLDINTFEPVSEMPLPSLADSRIRSLTIIGNYIVVLTKQKLIAFNLLTYQMSPLAVRIETPLGGKSLMAVDEDRDLICFCANYYHVNKSAKSNTKVEIRSRIFIFDPSSLKPVSIKDHECAIACVKYSKVVSGFILLDINSRVGVLNTVTSTFLLEEERRKEEKKAYEMAMLLNNAQYVSEITAANSASSKKEKSEIGDDTEELAVHKPINPDRLESVLSNMEGLPVEALFDRVMNIL